MRNTRPFLVRFARIDEEGAESPSIESTRATQSRRTTERPTHGTIFTKVRGETSDDQ